MEGTTKEKWNQMRAPTQETDEDATVQVRPQAQEETQTFKETNFDEILDSEAGTLFLQAVQSQNIVADQTSILKSSTRKGKEAVTVTAITKKGTTSQPQSSKKSQSGMTSQGKSRSTANQKTLASKAEPVINKTNHFRLNGGLIFMKHENKDVVVHTKVYSHFGKDCVAKIAKNQTVLRGKALSSDYCMLDSEAKISEFLKKSTQYKHLQNIEKLAEGGEAVVYKINYVGFDEVVLKVPRSKYQTQQGFEDLIYESQLIKAIYHQDYVVEVKEEIIEVDMDSMQLLRYCVVTERARFSLYDLYSFQAKPSGLVKSGLWFDEQKSRKELEKFSIEKFCFYFYQTMKALDYIHSQGIVYADMKPQNLLVMRNQKIKFGDFGISIVTQSTLQTYSLKGLTPQWCLPQIKADFQKAQQAGALSSFYKLHLTKEVLLQNDIYGMCLTFSRQLIKFLVPVAQQECESEGKAIIKFFDQIGLKLVMQKSLTIKQALVEANNCLLRDTSSVLKLVTQLMLEKKFLAVYAICQDLRNKTQKMVAASGHNHHALYLIRLQKLMGQSLFQQGAYKQALQELQAGEALINELVRSLNSKEMIQELENLNIESNIMQVKALLYQGNVQQGSQKARTTFEVVEKNPEFIKLYQSQVLELRGRLALWEDNFSQALSYYLEFAQKVDDRQKEGEVSISSLLNLGQAFYKLNDYDNSMKYYTKAQDKIIEMHSEQDPQILECLKSIGDIQLHQGNLEKATTNFNEALKICQVIFGEQNAATAHTYLQIGNLLSHKIQDQALSFYLKAEVIFEGLYGPDNHFCSNIYSNIGGVYERQGELAKAEQMCMRALSVKMKFSMEETCDFATIYQNLTKIKVKQNNYKSAINFSKRALDIKKSYLGMESQDTLQCLHQHCAMLITTGSFQEAKELLLKALSFHKKRPFQLNPILLRLNVLQGICQKRMGEHSGCLSSLHQVLETINKTNDTSLNNIKLEVLKELGSAHEEKGSPQCIEYYSEALKLGPSPIEEVILNQKIALSHFQRGQYEPGLVKLNKTEALILQLKTKIDPKHYIEFEINMLPVVRGFIEQCHQLLK